MGEMGCVREKDTILGREERGRAAEAREECGGFFCGGDGRRDTHHWRAAAATTPATEGVGDGLENAARAAAAAVPVAAHAERVELALGLRWWRFGGLFGSTPLLLPRHLQLVRGERREGVVRIDPPLERAQHETP